MKSKNSQRNKIHYVYAHIRSSDYKIFYIGVGTIVNLKATTPKTKYSRAYHFSNRNKFWRHVKSKHGIIVRILHRYTNKTEALNKEKILISKYVRRVIDPLGQLTNISEGGEIGPVGRSFVMSEKQKKKLSETKSHIFYVYSCEGKFLKEIKSIKKTAEFCGVTYNAVHSCLQTKNYSNGYLIFKEYKGKDCGICCNNIDFRSPLRKEVVTIDHTNNEIIHESIASAARYLNTDRAGLKKAIKTTGNCKKHRVFFRDNQQPRF